MNRKQRIIAELEAFKIAIIPEGGEWRKESNFVLDMAINIVESILSEPLSSEEISEVYQSSREIKNVISSFMDDAAGVPYVA